MKNIVRTLRHIAFVLSLPCLLSVISCSPDVVVDSPLLTPCEKAIHLDHHKPERVFSSDDGGYTIIYEVIDPFPSIKAFFTLEKQLLACGWKSYNKLGFPEEAWEQDISERGTLMTHFWGRTYIDQSEKRVVLLLISYYSRGANLRETATFSKPNNKKQIVRLQYHLYDEEEMAKALELSDRCLDSGGCWNYKEQACEYKVENCPYVTK